jgi:hypothetical protein
LTSPRPPWSVAQKWPSEVSESRCGGTPGDAYEEHAAGDRVPVRLVDGGTSVT